MKVSAKKNLNTSVSDNWGIYFLAHNQLPVSGRIYFCRYSLANTWGDRMRISYRSQMWNKHIFDKICFEGVRVLI